MSARHNAYEDVTYFPRVLRRIRHQNNMMTLQHLMEEAFDGNQRLREFWNEIEKENGGRSREWEGE
jgi:hypothetical protein